MNERKKIHTEKRKNTYKGARDASRVSWCLSDASRWRLTGWIARVEMVEVVLQTIIVNLCGKKTSVINK
jgi:hypothetical protein